MTAHTLDRDYANRSLHAILVGTMVTLLSSKTHSIKPTTKKFNCIVLAFTGQSFNVQSFGVLLPKGYQSRSLGKSHQKGDYSKQAMRKNPTTEFQPCKSF